MNFIEQILGRLHAAGGSPVASEACGGHLQDYSGAELLDRITTAREFLRRRGLAPGDRCALIGANGVCWSVLDLAILAEGLIAVPLYARQTPQDLAAILRDSRSALVLCDDAGLAADLRLAWPEGPQPDRLARDPLLETAALAPDDPVTIIYTSGTSGTAKGAMLTRRNVEHMLGCTAQRLGTLLAGTPGPQRILHYLPCCFAGSWIMMLTALGREGLLIFSTNIERLADDIRLARPHVFLNVPALLERVRRGIEQRLGGRGPRGRVFRRARRAWENLQNHTAARGDALWNRIGRLLIFGPVRRRVGADLLALICGSAPLSEDTQRFFHMLGLPVLQVYGLTETTAICTMDEPGEVVPGRVGRAIPGCEMTLSADGEILVRGPHVFAGYWNRPQDTAELLRDGWLHTGDQGEVDARGNWRITGRLKNMIILNSGHNIIPDALEEQLMQALPAARQVMLVGNQRGYLAAIVTGHVSSDQVEAGLRRVNPTLPHYKRIHRYCVHPASCAAI
jgi:long-chain acyl-CoA synthetase